MIYLSTACIGTGRSSAAHSANEPEAHLLSFARLLRRSPGSHTAAILISNSTASAGEKSVRVGDPLWLHPMRSLGRMCR